jgi:hypothetical protein
MSETTATPDRQAKASWVTRVLGVELGAGLDPTAGQQRAGEAAKEIAKGLGPLTMAFRKARLSWGAARNNARGAIGSLQARLREVLANEADFPALDAEIGKFDSIMEGLDDRLETTLDRALSGADADAMAALKAEAQKIIREYTSFVEQHPFLRKVDGNDFLPVTVFATLATELQILSKELA